MSKIKQFRIKQDSFMVMHLRPNMTQELARKCNANYITNPCKIKGKYFYNSNKMQSCILNKRKDRFFLKEKINRA